LYLWISNHEKNVWKTDCIDTQIKANSASLARDRAFWVELLAAHNIGSQVPVCPLQARPACRSRTASCYITCVRYCMYYSLRARPTLVASVTIVISCSRRTRTAKSDNKVHSNQILCHPWLFLCGAKNIPQLSCVCIQRFIFSYIVYFLWWHFIVFNCCIR